MRPIPPSVQSEIFRKYLQGYSIPALSKLFNVSVGAVSAIANELSKKDDYFIVIREVTKMFKDNNLEISDVISGIRLNNQVKETGLTISFFENFLEVTNTESFRLNKDHSEFLENIKRIVHFEELYGIKIEKIPRYMIDKIKHLKNLKEKNKKIIEKNTRLYLQYKIEKSEIEEYEKEKPLDRKSTRLNSSHLVISYAVFCLKKKKKKKIKIIVRTKIKHTFKRCYKVR